MRVGVFLIAKLTAQQPFDALFDNSDCGRNQGVAMISSERSRMAGGIQKIHQVLVKACVRERLHKRIVISLQMNKTSKMYEIQHLSRQPSHAIACNIKGVELLHFPNPCIQCRQVVIPHVESPETRHVKE